MQFCWRPQWISGWIYNEPALYNKKHTPSYYHDWFNLEVYRQQEAEKQATASTAAQQQKKISITRVPTIVDCELCTSMIVYTCSFSILLSGVYAPKDRGWSDVVTSSWSNVKAQLRKEKSSFVPRVNFDYLETPLNFTYAGVSAGKEIINIIIWKVSDSSALINGKNQEGHIGSSYRVRKLTSCVNLTYQVTKENVGPAVLPWTCCESLSYISQQSASPAVARTYCGLDLLWPETPMSHQFWLPQTSCGLDPLWIPWTCCGSYLPNRWLSFVSTESVMKLSRHIRKILYCKTLFNFTKSDNCRPKLFHCFYTLRSKSLTSNIYTCSSGCNALAFYVLYIIALIPKIKCFCILYILNLYFEIYKQLH